MEEISFNNVWPEGWLTSNPVNVLQAKVLTGRELLKTFRIFLNLNQIVDSLVWKCNLLSVFNLLVPLLIYCIICTYQDDLSFQYLESISPGNSQTPSNPVHRPNPRQVAR